MKSKKKKEEYSDFVPINEEVSDADGDDSNLAVVVRKLKKELKACTNERREYLEGWQRARADLINTKKTNTESRKQHMHFATEALIHDLIPVLDSFDMAFGDIAAWEKIDKNWRQGVEYISEQLLRTLHEHGVEAISPDGEQFDPALHESIATVPPSPAHPSGTITSVQQKGYRLNGKIIRPAKVEVATESRS